LGSQNTDIAMSGMSKHGYDKQSRVPTGHGRLHIQGTSYIGATKERVKFATEEQVWHQKMVVTMCVREQMQVGPPEFSTT